MDFKCEHTRQAKEADRRWTGGGLMDYWSCMRECSHDDDQTEEFLFFSVFGKLFALKSFFS